MPDEKFRLGFLIADKRLYKRLCPSVRWSVGPSVRRSVGEHELKSGKTRISAPAHPSATGIGRVSGLVEGQKPRNYEERVRLCLLRPLVYL